MITENQLRPGNILNYDTGEGIFPTIIDWQDLKWLNEKPEDFNKFHDRIKITKEILVKKLGWIELNFRPNIFIMDYGKNGTSFIKILPDGLFYYELGTGKSKQITYVDELQNLHFFITDTELTFDTKII